MTVQPGFDFDQVERASLTVARSPFLEARETSALAAAQAAPKAGAVALRLLELVALAGDDGMCDSEISRAMKIPRSTVCARRNDVRSWLWPADRRGVSEYGKPQTCWRRATADEVAINRMRRTEVRS